MRCLLIIVALLGTWPAYPAADDAPSKHTFEFSGLSRTFYLYAPVSNASSPVPLLLTLHGSYGKAHEMIGQWVGTARANGFIVAAPVAQRPAAWQIRADGPQFMRALVDEIARIHPIDRQRTYLFGHSGGAVYALTLSMLESDYFAATAVFAGAWRTPQEFIAVPYARRAVPVAIFIGDRDEYFPLHDARKTYRALQEAGHPSNLTILPRRTHSYAKAAVEINPSAWNWLKAYSSNTMPAASAH